MSSVESPLRPEPRPDRARPGSSARETQIFVGRGETTLSFEEFRKLLSQRLGMPEEKFTPEASFLDDLAVDSIRMVELILEFERMGIKIPPESVWDIQKVGDAYNFYLKYA